jgi:hypothetical protein
MDAIFQLICNEVYRYMMVRSILVSLPNEFITKYKDRIWETYYDNKLDEPDLLLKLLEIEGKTSKALKMLKKQQSTLLQPVKDKFEEMLLEYKIEDSFTLLNEKMDNVERKELKNLENSINERLKLQANISERMFNDLIKQIKEHDLFLTDERKEGLQNQINSTNTRIDDINKYLDRDKRTMQIWLGILSALITVLLALVAIVYPILLSNLS